MQRSVKDIKADIRKNMKTLGKLTIIKRISCTVSIICVFISIYYFTTLFTDNDYIIYTFTMMVTFMVISILFVILYAILTNICTERKRIIYNDKRILKRIAERN